MTPESRDNLRRLLASYDDMLTGIERGDEQAIEQARQVLREAAEASPGHLAFTIRGHRAALEAMYQKGAN